jgi:hypothetical protein
MDNTASLLIETFGSFEWNADVYDLMSGVSRLASIARSKANVLSIAYSLHKANRKLEEFLRTSDGVLDGSIKPKPAEKPITNEDIRRIGYTLHQMHSTIAQILASLKRVNLTNNSLTASSIQRMSGFNERIMDLADWIEAIQLPETTTAVFERAESEKEMGELFDLAQVS